MKTAELKIQSIRIWKTGKRKMTQNCKKATTHSKTKSGGIFISLSDFLFSMQQIISQKYVGNFY